MVFVRNRFLTQILVGLSLLLAILGSSACQYTVTEKPATRVKAQFTADLQQFEKQTAQLLQLAERTASTDSLQQAFVASRRAYKRLEPLAEYYFPATTRLVNGPPVPEVEIEETKLFQPEGLQVIEPLLYPGFDTTRRTELVQEIGKLRQETSRYKTLWEVAQPTDEQVFDALRLAVFRIIALGISGFDTPGCQTAMPEAAVALASVRTYASFYSDEQPTAATLQQDLYAAEAYLKQHPDFATFDRATFITRYANPLSAKLLAYQQELSIAPLTDRRPLRANAPTLFAPDVFDADAYAATVDDRMNPAKVALGKQLFADPILSSNNQRACISCHQPDKAFTDGLVRNKTLTGQGVIGRNTPTLLNAALQAGQFYDTRSASLENQSFDVIHNANEMRGSLLDVVRKLEQQPAYVAQFKRAFPRMKQHIEPAHVQNALASYERTLLSFDSRFDQYMRGRKQALSDQEVQGLNLFMGKARCGTCHFMPLFNGTVPPAFTDTESEVLGVPETRAGKKLDPDLGRYAHTKLDPLQYSFKTPTLRNVARTAPYMHNGVYQTLEQVVDFYNRGGGQGLGFNLPNQTLAPDSLRLSQAEQAALVSFIKAL